MKKIFLFLALICTVLFACKKKETCPVVAPVPTHYGVWKGKYSLTPGGIKDQDVVCVFYRDGTSKVFNGVDTISAVDVATGIHALSGQIILTQHTYASSSTTFFLRIVADANFTTSVDPTVCFWGTGTMFASLNYVQPTMIGDVQLTKQP
jgi:hypothetical protein